MIVDGGRCEDVPGQVVQRLLTLTAAIWHDWLIGTPDKRSLVAYDH